MAQKSVQFPSLTITRFNSLWKTVADALMPPSTMTDEQLRNTIKDSQQRHKEVELLISDQLALVMRELTSAMEAATLSGKSDIAEYFDKTLPAEVERRKEVYRKKLLELDGVTTPITLTNMPTPNTPTVSNTPPTVSNTPPTLLIAPAEVTIAPITPPATATPKLTSCGSFVTKIGDKPTQIHTTLCLEGVDVRKNRKRIEQLMIEYVGQIAWCVPLSDDLLVLKVVHPEQASKLLSVTVREGDIKLAIHQYHEDLPVDRRMVDLS